MQLDDKTANAVSVRPTADAAGAQRWFRARDLGGGITGTTMEEDYLNDMLGNMIALLAKAGITRTKGASGDSDLLNSIEIVAAPHDLLIAKFAYVSVSSASLRPIVGTDIRISIDGLVLKKTGDLTFDHSLDFDGTEVASSAVYYYVEDVASVLTPHATHTAPDLPGGTKPGYHPTNLTWRCIGALWNDPALDLVPSDIQGQWVNFTERKADQYDALSLTVPLAWTSLTMNVPNGCDAVRIISQFGGDDVAVVFGASDAPGTLPTTGPAGLNDTGMQGVLALLSPEVSGAVLHAELPIADPSTPAIRYGNIDVGTVVITLSEVKVTAYHFPYLPR